MRLPQGEKRADKIEDFKNYALRLNGKRLAGFAG
jgi:hypothetical protein